MPLYSDFTDRFLQSRSGDLGIVTDDNAIKSAVRNLVLTANYERPIDPYIGSNIRKALFSTNFASTVKELQDSISLTLKNYEPRIKLIDVVCSPDTQDHNLIVKIIYSILSSPAVQSVEVTLRRLR